ncbi:xyloglucan endotransglucosylase/hydrolase protein 22-like [Chenopodium quinoa]|uniref:Xyloglucan endotransglucosylase/hydrolase n=1 Tax=Chenopodium quinoa TaxID=63459 RepID=A0A803MFP4_CHEQI|nr:xyloglucan endotransglucosylase/hydrolase protein 22-like [Chenopodium quinoa]
MHMHRSSSSPSFLPSICSVHTFIGLAVILCVYFTLQTSISLQDKSLPSEQIKTTLPSSILLPQQYDSNDMNFNEIPTMEQPPPHSNEKTILRSPPKAEILGLARDFDIAWGNGRGTFHDNGTLLTLSLDKNSGSGFESKNRFLFAKIDMKIKLIPNNSAGTVTTFYMSSNGSTHDEIDFEFLGNVSGQPYTIHTNIYCQGKGNREQQFYLWFDPTADFHSYSILWNPARIVFFVDGTPIREFNNMEEFGVPFPNKQPMRIFSSLWNADDWATQGGKVHTDWSKAPFVASFKNFKASSCVWSHGSSSCGSDDLDSESSGFENAWLREELDSKSLRKMRRVQQNYMTYNYCDDKMRFHEGLPKECTTKGSNRGRQSQFR